MFIIGLGITLVGWAFWLEPASLRVAENRLSISTWPSTCDGLRIAVLADLHIGSPFNGLDRLNEVIEQTNKAMQEMDKVTQRNAGNSETLSGLATHLGNGAAKLSTSVRAMRYLVSGIVDPTAGLATEHETVASSRSDSTEGSPKTSQGKRLPPKVTARLPGGDGARAKNGRVSRDDSRFKIAS